MTKKELLENALDGVKSEYVESAGKILMSRPAEAPRSFYIVRIAAIAAAIVLIITCLPVLFIGNDNVDSPSQGLPPLGSDPNVDRIEGDIFSGYAEIINTFREIVDTVDAQGEPRSDIENAEKRDIYESLWDVVISHYPLHIRMRENSHRFFAKFIFNYAFTDLNGDGRDELVFLNDYGTVEALFTHDGQRAVMLGGYVPTQMCGITERGYITVWGDHGMTVYSLTKGGDLEQIDRMYTVNDGINSKTYYYREINGEEKEITAGEFDSLIESYSDAELESEPLYGERGRAMRALLAALENEINVYDPQFGEYKRLYYCYDVGSGNYIGYYAMAAENSVGCAAVDLDGDGIEEIVLDMEGRGVLRYYEGEVYYYGDIYRKMINVYTDGSFSFSYGPALYGLARMKFDGAKQVTDTVCSIADDGTEYVKYYVGGESVTKEELDAFVSESCTEKVEFLPICTQCGGWFTKIDSVDSALRIAEINWGVKNGETDVDTGGRYEITVSESSIYKAYVVEMILVAEDGTVLRTYTPISIDKYSGVISKG